jgi:23S rRNA pseudouridine1911/1915/1917 synthase
MKRATSPLRFASSLSSMYIMWPASYSARGMGPLVRVRPHVAEGVAVATQGVARSWWPLATSRRHGRRLARLADRGPALPRPGEDARLGATVRLDLALIHAHPSLSRRKAREVIEKGQVTVDGRLVREPGRDVDEKASIGFDPHRPALPRARCRLRILYEDEHLLVVDKPSGLLTVPSGPGRLDEDTALGRVQEYARHLRPRNAYAERVHRLDRDTSGALAFALSREARSGLIRTFRAHRIDRVYLAVVEGEPREERGEVQAPLRDTWVSGRRGVARGDEPAVSARTRWRVRERFPEATLLEVELDTGRQHQIRVHLAHVGLPVVGDRVYGGPRRGAGPPARRPMLHSFRLAFDHPVHGRRVDVSCPPPEDFLRVVEDLRRRARAGRPPRRSRQLS